MMNKPTLRKTMSIRTGCFALFTTLMIAGFSLKIQAQQPVTEQAESRNPTRVEGDIYFAVEEQPQYKGGMAALHNYISNELNYPLKAREQGIEGQVEVQFVVEKDGSLSNVTAFNNIRGGLADEAVRVVKRAPAFSPGKQRGKPVRVQMVLPIRFSLNKDLLDGDKLPTGGFALEELDQRNGKLKVDAEYANGLWTGTVQDPDGNFLPGATIVVVETYRGSVTDIYGRFTIDTSPSEILNISFVGYESSRIGRN